MSKSIWHFPSEAPAYCFQCVFYDTVSDEYHFGQYSPVFKHFRSGNSGWEHEEVQRFAFAKDIIDCLAELDRTRKALEITKNAINSAVDHNIINCVARGIDPRTDDTNVTLCNALEKITALEQKDVK